MAESDQGLPAEAIAALARGNKIEAIKIVRQGRNIDLKDAKDRVEEYVRNNPALQQKLAAAQAESRGTFFRWLIVFVLLATAAYYVLASR
jgi:ribosomal protein L7/L12